jgi:hypothetical protein
MLVLADNDVTGAVNAIRHVLESSEWRSYTKLVGVEFTCFEDLGLPRSALDRAVWQPVQGVDAVLITANRAGDADSLDAVIRELSGPNSMPVLTLADPTRLVRDRTYAEACAMRLLDYLDRIESLRGTGRLFLP